MKIHIPTFSGSRLKFVMQGLNLSGGSGQLPIFF